MRPLKRQDRERSSKPWTIEMGGMRITPFVSSRFRLDGGSMFGVVPRALWEKKAPPDEQNRILLNSNSLLIETAGNVVLVEPGMGSKYDERQREIYDIEEVDVSGEIERLGIVPERIGMVIPTHLHFDHAGGSTTVSGARGAVPAFPRAKLVVQRSEWEAAARPHPVESGSYRPDDFVPFEEAGMLELVEGDADVTPGMRVEWTGGHTRGHQVVRLISGGDEALYPGDLVPTTAHLKLNWLMAWDLEPAATYERKAALLEDCAKRGVLIFWAHDPFIAACRVLEVKPGSYEIDEETVIEAAN